MININVFLVLEKQSAIPPPLALTPSHPFPPVFSHLHQAHSSSLNTLILRCSAKARFEKCKLLSVTAAASAVRSLAEGLPLLLPPPTNLSSYQRSFQRGFTAVVNIKLFILFVSAICFISQCLDTANVACALFSLHI